MSSFTPISTAACLSRPLLRPPLPRLKPSSTACRSSRWADRLLADFHFLPPSIPSPSLSPPSLLSILPSPPTDRPVPLPIDYYLILNAEPHFLADSIRRAFDSKLSRPPHPAFTPAALFARRQILQAACDTLSDPAARADYNLGLATDTDLILTISVPLDKVPGALCLLQEAGQAELVINAGLGLLRERLAKPVKVRKLLEEDASLVNSHDYDNLTPLHVATLYDWIDVGKCLLEFGADVNAQDRWKNTVAALYFLGMTGHFGLGNSNNLATIDVAGAFIGISSHSTVLSGILMFAITYASPILSFLSMLVYIPMKELMCFSDLKKADLGSLLQILIVFPYVLPLVLNSVVLTAFTIILLLMRNHLFVWSVFSPKYLYVCVATVNVYVGVCIIAATVAYVCAVIFFRTRMLR